LLHGEYSVWTGDRDLPSDLVHRPYVDVSYLGGAEEAKRRKIGSYARPNMPEKSPQEMYAKGAA
jgi:hypothetical protein